MKAGAGRGAPPADLPELVPVSPVALVSARKVRLCCQVWLDLGDPRWKPAAVGEFAGVPEFVLPLKKREARLVAEAAAAWVQKMPLLLYQIEPRLPAGPTDFHGLLLPVYQALYDSGSFPPERPVLLFCYAGSRFCALGDDRWLPCATLEACGSLYSLLGILVCRGERERAPRRDAPYCLAIPHAAAAPEREAPECPPD